MAGPMAVAPAEWLSIILGAFDSGSLRIRESLGTLGVQYPQLHQVVLVMIGVATIPTVCFAAFSLFSIVIGILTYLAVETVHLISFILFNGLIHFWFLFGVDAHFGRTFHDPWRGPRSRTARPVGVPCLLCRSLCRSSNSSHSHGRCRRGFVVNGVKGCVVETATIFALLLNATECKNQFLVFRPTQCATDAHSLTSKEKRRAEKRQGGTQT